MMNGLKIFHFIEFKGHRLLSFNQSLTPKFTPKPTLFLNYFVGIMEERVIRSKLTSESTFPTTRRVSTSSAIVTPASELLSSPISLIRDEKGKFGTIYASLGYILDVWDSILAKDL